MAPKYARTAIAIASIGIGLYSLLLARFAVHYGLFMDDMWFLQFSRTLQSVILPQWNQDLVRPVPAFLFVIANELGDFNLWGHIINAVVNALTWLVSFAVLLDISWAHRPMRLRSIDWLFISALSVSQLLHPSTGYNLLWVSGLQTLLGGLFFVLVVWSVIRFQRTKNWRWLVVLALSALLGFFSYEGALALVVVVPVVYWYFDSDCRTKYGKYAIGSLLFPLLLYFSSRMLSGAQAVPETSVGKGMLTHWAEYLVVMINGIDRSLFTYMVYVGGHLDINDWLTVIIFTALPVICFYSLLALGLLRNLRERRYKLVMVAFVLMLVAAIPVLVFRRAFVPRLAYMQVFSFMLTLTIGYWASEKHSRYFFCAALLLLFVQVHSFAELTNITEVVSTVRTEFASSVVANTSVSSPKLIGLSPYSYRDFPVLVATDDELAWRIGAHTRSSELGLYVLKNVRGPTEISEAVACTQVGVDKFRYVVLSPWLYIKEKGAEDSGGYYIGQSVVEPGGFRYVILNVNRVGYITDFELSVPQNGRPTDCKYWQGKDSQ